jgi:hypothetical protein
MTNLDLTARGYTPPSAMQFSVFLDNRCGKLLELLALFERHEVHLTALSVIESADCAIARLLSVDSELTGRVMKEASLSFAESEVLIVGLTPERTLNSLCRALLSAELNIHAAYPLLIQPPGTPTMVLQCDDLHLAAQILRSKNFELFGESDLAT